MAFRSYDATTTDTNSFGTAGTLHTISLPDCDAGDALIIMMSTKGESGAYARPNGQHGYSQRLDQGYTFSSNYNRYIVWTHYCDGNEGDNDLSITLDNSGKLLAKVIRLPGFHKDPNVSTEISFTSFTNNTNANPDSPASTPSWGSADTLWLTLCFYQDDDGTVSSYPANYSDGSNLLSGAGTNESQSMYCAFRENAVATENPGTATLSESERWYTTTVAVRPYVTHTINGASYLVKNLDTDQVYYNGSNTTARTLYSVTKLMTLAVVRDNMTASFLANNSRTLISDDVTSGTTTSPALQASDVVDLIDLVTAALLPSSNTAANALAAEVGEDLYGAGTYAQYMTEFYDAMDSLGSSISLVGPSGGWTDAAGWPTTDSVSADDVFKILGEVIDDSTLTDEMKKAADTIVIDRGGNTNIDCDHTLQGYGFYHEAANHAFYGKTGSGGGNFNIAMVWDTPSSERVAIIVLHATSGDNRAADVRHFVKQLVDNYSGLLTPTLTPAKLSQVQTLDGVTVTLGSETITPNDASQAQIIDAPTLTQHHIIGPNALDQAQSIDGVTVTPDTTLLTVADVGQPQAIENLSVTPSGIVKGVRVTLYNGAALQPSITGITAFWWDSSPPVGAPDYSTASASTDASGVLELNLHNDSGLSVGQEGFLMLWKEDTGDVQDSPGFVGEFSVIDIA